jgi:fatty-acid peroxygenase
MDAYRKIPCDVTIDNSLAMLFEGYCFIQNRCDRYKTDIFQTRLLGQKAICMRGEEAAEIFYDNNCFKRKGVAPMRVQKTLTGLNGVQGLDGEAHIDRKRMFMSIMTHENLKNLTDYTTDQWKANSAKWVNNDIVLFDEAQRILCQVACRWAGVPLQRNEIKQRATDLGKMIDGFGAIGLRNRQGRCARERSEEWIRGIITEIRSHRLTPAKGTAADIIAWHRDQNQKLLGTQIAAVELLNIIRPMVAIATYITFGALAMHEHPECRNRFQSGENDYQQMFVQEVRRFYPFTPYVAAQAKKGFLWKRYYIRKGTLVILDIYGTNHDPRLWSDPYEFLPERFKHWSDHPFTFMPQGGGDISTGHRCAGEMVTTEVMKVSLNFIANSLAYRVPRQCLSYRLSRIPTLPKSRFKMSKVRRIN